jgi:hypothetical protein
MTATKLKKMLFVCLHTYKFGLNLLLVLINKLFTDFIFNFKFVNRTSLKTIYFIMEYLTIFIIIFFFFFFFLYRLIKMSRGT